jgi:DNA-binding NarL/FixJ family response regulator
VAAGGPAGGGGDPRERADRGGRAGGGRRTGDGRTGEAQAIVDRIAAGLRAPELRASRLVAGPVAVLVADAVPVVGGSGRLSVRETEVLRLVARGFTNQRIASELSISERTVNSHLVHIFNKLGVDNRVAAAMHAVRAGLADQAS